MLKQKIWRLEKVLRRKFDPFPHLSYVRKQKFLFIHIPKTAGTSILKSFSIPFRHHSDYKVFKSADSDLFKKSFKFCFVRNPYDRLVSIYRYLKSGGAGYTDKKICELINTEAPSFELFVEHFLDTQILHTHPLFKPQFSYICDFKFDIQVDFLARFEKIEDDTSEIAKKINKKVILEKLNSQSKVNFKDFYNDSLAQKVFELYQKDFELFNYRKDSYK